MREGNVRKRRKRYSAFELKNEGLTALKGTEGLVFSEGKNCDFSKGRMARGLGVSELKSEDGSEMLPSFSIDNLVAACPYYEWKEEKKGWNVGALLKNGSIRTYDEEEKEFVRMTTGLATDSFILPVHQKGMPTMLAVLGGNGVHVVSSTWDKVTVYGNAVAPLGAFFHGRIFFVDGVSIRYTAPFQFEVYEESADEGGRVELGAEGGAIVALVAVGEKLFAVRERAILEISAFGAAREFSVKTIAYGGGDIQKGSVCGVGESLVFLSSDGVYRFLDGKFVKLLSGLPSRFLESEKVVASTAENKYRLAYTLQGGEEKVLVVDVEEGSAYFSFGLCGVHGGGQTVGMHGETLYRVGFGGELPQGEECYALSKNLDFGESGEKVLRRLSFVGGGNVEVAVRSIRGEKRAILSLKPSAVFEFALKGKEFEMEFHLGKGAFVESLEAEYDLLGGEE